MRRRFIQRARAADFPLNYSESVVLVHIADDQGTNQATLANQLDIESITVVSLLDSLEKAALIKRRPHATDRRQWTLWLTEAAYPMLDHIRSIAQLAEKEALAGIRKVRCEELVDALVQLNANLSLATNRKRNRGPAIEPLNPPQRRIKGHDKT